MKNLNCLLCGVGGQGTVLASKLIAGAAMEKGLTARTAETIGMAQRGGCVVSHVRTGEVVHSPMIPKGEADVIIAFEPAEAVRCLEYLRDGGTVITARKAVRPVTATLGGSGYTGGEMLDYLAAKSIKLIVVDGEAICAECGSSKVLNVALLGAAAHCGALGITSSELEGIILQRVPQKFHELNLKALKLSEKYI